MGLQNRIWSFLNKHELTALVKPNPFGGLGNQLKPLGIRAPLHQQYLCNYKYV
jgi:hypothetical protein